MWSAVIDQLDHTLQLLLLQRLLCDHRLLSHYLHVLQKLLIELIVAFHFGALAREVEHVGCMRWIRQLRR